MAESGAKLANGEVSDGRAVEVSGEDTLPGVFRSFVDGIWSPGADGDPLLRRLRTASCENAPRLREASRNSARDLVAWTKQGSGLRAILVISVGTITLIALTGLLIFMSFLLVATANAIVVSVLMSLAAAGGFLALFFACLVAVYVGAVSVAIFVISATVISAIVGVMIATVIGSPIVPADRATASIMMQRRLAAVETDLIVASAGDDKKISLWHKKGQNVGQLPTSTVDRGDDIEESIYSISFSNKGSRYLCSGGSGHIVRIWDLQRKRCIKWLSGHTDTITGVMYNCKDEHLASISMKGDLILHNLASGARAAELSDPNGQVLRVLDYSRNSRHILATAGDDGSVHLWDTTARTPKVSWLKQHSAPISGVCISPSSDKIIATVGLDKKLHTLDSGSRRATHTIPHDAPFSSLAYNDDGTILAAGTNSGRVVFYDVRGKPQPLTILRAYNSSEAVTSLCWQRSKPVIVKENSSSEVALLGGTSEDSILMPDPLPSTTPSTFSAGAGIPSIRSSLTGNTGGFLSTSNSSTAEETPYRARPLSGGPLSKLQAPRGNFNIKDDMDVFSPLVDVQPFTPSSNSWWDEHGSDETKKDEKSGDKKLLTTRKFQYMEGNTEPHPISDWRSNSISRQDGATSASTTPIPSWKSEPSISSLESSTGNALPERLIQRQQISRFGQSAFQTGSLAFAGLQDSASSTSLSMKGSLTSNILMNLQNKGILSNVQSSLETSSASLQVPVSSSFVSKTVPSVKSDLPGAAQSNSSWKPSTFTDRLSTSSVFSEGLASAFGSPKSKKTGAETKDELLTSLLSRQEAPATSSSGSLLASNGVVPPQLPTSGLSADQQGASSFSLQYVQRMLEESLGSVHKSIHEDVRNLHIELLRQFHMQEMETSGVMNLVLEKLEGLTKEVQQLRRENQQLRHQLL